MKLGQTFVIFGTMYSETPSLQYDFLTHLTFADFILHLSTVAETTHVLHIIDILVNGLLTECPGKNWKE